MTIELFTLVNRDAEPEPEFRISHYDGARHSFHGDDTSPRLVRASGHWQQDCQVDIAIERYLILSYTPSGVWIEQFDGKKFVNLRAGKQWASVTEEEAIDQLYWRKCSQVRILESRLESAQRTKAVLEKHFGKKPRAPRRYSGESDYY